MSAHPTASSDVVLRPVRPAEHAEVGTLVLAAYDRVGRLSDDYRRQLRDTGARIDDESTVLVAVDDTGALLGTITVVTGCSTHFELAGHADGGIRALAVAPAAQGRGVGRSLVEHALAEGRAAGWRRVALTTMTFMHAAQRLYEDLGFARRPDLDVAYPAGVGRVFVLDLVPDAATAFPLAGPVPAEPPWYEDADRGGAAC